MALTTVRPQGMSFNTGRRNMVINGAMQVAQRGTSTTGLKNTGGVYTLDRFSYRRGGTWTNLQVKHEQVDVTDSLPLSAGFNKALKVTCTTAEGSVPASGEATAIGYYLEKGDTHRLGVGSSSMKKSTLSFYVKSSIATTFGIAIVGYQHSTTQKIKIPFTVSTANTYERISVEIPTYNVALDSDADTVTGWAIHWVLDGEAATATNSVWGSSSDQGVMLPNGVSTTAFSNTANATFEITGVQLEVGENASDFEHRSYGEELAACQRYFYRWISESNYGNLSMGVSINTTKARGLHTLPVEMRSQPTFSSNGTFRIAEFGGHSANTTDESITRNHKRTPFMNFTVASGLTNGKPAELGANNDDDAFCDFDAEL